jgi:hypothetical protein
MREGNYSVCVRYLIEKRSEIQHTAQGDIFGQNVEDLTTVCQKKKKKKKVIHFHPKSHHGSIESLVMKPEREDVLDISDVCFEGLYNSVDDWIRHSTVDKIR